MGLEDIKDGALFVLGLIAMFPFTILMLILLALAHILGEEIDFEHDPYDRWS